MFAVVFAQFVGDGVLAFAFGNTLNRSAHDKVEALFREHLLEGLLNVAVHARGDHVEEFNNGHISAEAFVDRTQFEADDACADHNHRFRDRFQGQCASRCDNGFFVHFDTR